MRSRAVIVLGLVLAMAAAACTAMAHHPKLGARYEYTVGDDIAQRTESVLRLTAGLEEPTLVSFDREKQNIVVVIIGNTDSVEGAKREIEGLVDIVRAEVVTYARKRHGLELTDKDVTLIYDVDSDQGVPEEVVRREDGEYVVPKAENDEKE